MNWHLAEISWHVLLRAIALLVCWNVAGWTAHRVWCYRTHRYTAVAAAPELIPVENVWALLRGDLLCHRA
jgi:hypothetical protein